jgi:hypothetical protein
VDESVVDVPVVEFTRLVLPVEFVVRVESELIVL